MRTLLLTAFLIVPLAACGGPSEPTKSSQPTGAATGTVGDAPACVCEQGKAGTPVWCEACNKGYVDGQPADCPLCVKKEQEKLEAAD